MTLAYGREGLTPDIDALTSHAAVFDEATRTEAMRIGEWAHQFASELRNG